LKARERNSPSGNIGAELRPSSQIKAASSNTPIDNAPTTVASLQPEIGAEIKPKARLPRPPRASSEPRQSRAPLASTSWLSGTLRIVIHSVGTASSGLIRKIQRHVT